MKGLYYRVIGHMFSVLFVISQLFSTSDVYVSSYRSVESSIGNDFLSILQKEHSKADKYVNIEDITHNNSIEFKEEQAEVNTDNVVSHEEYVPVETQKEVVLTTQNSISIDSIYYRPLMNDDGSYFYLDHNIYGEYDNIGVPFIDSRTDFTTRKTILYAHSSKSGNGPFQILQNYMDSSFFYQHPIITITYNGNTYRYQIFSVYVSLADDDYSDGLEYFNHISYSDSRWDKAIHNYKDYSIYDTGVEVTSSDKIIILQTCSMDDRYYEKYYRYNLLVMGKLI